MFEIIYLRAKNGKDRRIIETKGGIGMNWWGGTSQRYNREFAVAVAKAKLADKKKFRFKGNVYLVADHIRGVLADVREKRYRLKMV